MSEWKGVVAAVFYTYPPTIKEDVPPPTLIINRGAVDGVQVNDFAVVSEQRVTVTDPSTGENLGPIDKPPLARLQVVKVEERVAFLRVDQWYRAYCRIEQGMGVCLLREKEYEETLSQSIML